MKITGRKLKEIERENQKKISKNKKRSLKYGSKNRGWKGNVQRQTENTKEEQQKVIK